MGKRLVILTLICLLLAGCGGPAPSETLSPALPPTEETQPQEDPGLYLPQSPLETATGGAVRVYSPGNSQVSGIAAMGDALLVFTLEKGGTTVTRRVGPELRREREIFLPMVLTPGDPLLQVFESGLACYSFEKKETLLLDEHLEEVSRIPAPQDMVGSPLLSRDRKALFYCTDKAVKMWEFSTGIRRVLKELAYPSQTVSGLYLEDGVLSCSFTDSNFESRTLFLSTATGETLYLGPADLQVAAENQRYCAQVPVGSSRQFVFGDLQGTAMELIPHEPAVSCLFLPRSQRAAALCLDEQGGYFVACYDLATGACRSVLPLPEGTREIRAAEAEDGKLWLLVVMEKGVGEILLWDTAALPGGPEGSFTQQHFTDSHPDLAGLADCQLYADEIGSRYGIRVLIGEEASAREPWDYDLETEYRVPVLRRDLEKLDRQLSHYPEGILRTLAEQFEGLNICIVRSIRGTAESGSLDTATGIQFWEEFGAFIALTADMDTEHTLYHELCHLLENVILTQCSALDSWEHLNPSGFLYDYSYTVSRERNTELYLHNETRYFIDTYSMTYPKEDRARIMEYAMTPGNEGLFRSATMQSKLKLLCQGIRQAFDLRRSPETFLWEQYLKEPLAYIPES